MPRVTNHGPSVDSYCRATGNGSATEDLCNACAGRLARNSHCFDHLLIPDQHTQGENGWGGDLEHPPYDECDYRCSVCEKTLTDANA